MSTAPEALRAVLAEQAIEIRWNGGLMAKIPFRELRGLCPCANCVNELTGERIFFADQASQDIRPKKMELVGNYATRIHWSDGHHTGLYTWDYLKELSESFPG